MKKLLLITSVIILGIIAGKADESRAIIERFLEKTNIAAIDSKEKNIKMEYTVALKQGMEMEIETKVTIQKPGDNVRMEMKVMGQEMTNLIIGDKAWVIMMGQNQELPAEQIEDIKKQADIYKSLRFLEMDKEGTTMTYVGEENGIQTVKIVTTEKETEKTSILRFNKEDGLLKNTETLIEGKTITTEFLEYKEFGESNLPVLMKSTDEKGKEMLTITVKDVQVGVLVLPYMFAKPN